MRRPVFFENARALRQWFARHAKSEAELVVGYLKRGTGRPSITWPESVDEALCVGWIDGVRKRIDGERYQIRFTPRKPHSNWSNINIRRVAALRAAGRMRPAGRSQAAPGEPGRVAVLPDAAVGIRQDDFLVDHPREATRDARSAAGAVHREVRGAKTLHLVMAGGDRGIRNHRGNLAGSIFTVTRDLN